MSLTLFGIEHAYAGCLKAFHKLLFSLMIDTGSAQDGLTCSTIVQQMVTPVMSECGMLGFSAIVSAVIKSTVDRPHGFIDHIVGARSCVSFDLIRSELLAAMSLSSQSCCSPCVDLADHSCLSEIAGAAC